MSWDTLITIGITVLSGIAYCWMNLMSKIEKLQDEVATKLDEQQVRQLLQDKVEPLKEDLNEIKATINRIYNHIIDKNG